MHGGEGERVRAVGIRNRQMGCDNDDDDDDIYGETLYQHHRETVTELRQEPLIRLAY